MCLLYGCGCVRDGSGNPFLLVSVAFALLLNCGFGVAVGFGVLLLLSRIVVVAVLQGGVYGCFWVCEQKRLERTARPFAYARGLCDGLQRVTP
ncbi:MAG: hypothetical protein LBF01_02900 [Bacteroidales bacterium]|nr:hypothetical protein [Bacteroidales bacterium]